MIWSDRVRVVGFSFGGMVASLWAAAHPARVRRLLLLGAPGLGIQRAQPLDLRMWSHLPEGAPREAVLRHTLAVEFQQEDSHRPYWGTPVRQPATGRLSVLPQTVGRNYNVADGYYGQDVRWVRSLLEWTPGEHDTVRNTVYHYDALRDYRNVESYRLTTGNDGVIRSGTLLQRHDQQLYGNRLEWSHDGALFGLPTQWATGLDVSYNRQTRFPLSLSATVDTVPLDAVTPGRFLDVPGTWIVYTPDRTNRLHTQALYLENLTELTPSLSLLTGLRRDRIVLDVVNHRAVTATNPARFEREYTPTTGRVALNWAITPQASVYAQYSTAADPPAGILSTANFATLRDFDLTTGRQGEVGAKFQSRDARHFATLAAYRIVRRNLAITDPANPGQTLPVAARGTALVQPAQDQHLRRQHRDSEEYRVEDGVGPLGVGAIRHQRIPEENHGSVPFRRTEAAAGAGRAFRARQVRVRCPPQDRGDGARLAARELGAVRRTGLAGHGLLGRGWRLRRRSDRDDDRHGAVR